MEKKFQVVEIETASKTINKADPTQVIKFVGKKVLAEFDDLESAKQFIIKDQEEEAEAYDMSAGMCDEYTPDMRDPANMFIVDIESDKRYNVILDIGMEEDSVCEYKVYLCEKTFEEMYGTGEWVM